MLPNVSQLSSTLFFWEILQYDLFNNPYHVEWLFHIIALPYVNVGFLCVC